MWPSKWAFNLMLGIGFLVLANHPASRSNAVTAKTRGAAALPEHLAEFAQVVDRFFKFRRFDASLAAGAVAFAEQH